jgi:hypothetical protein
MGSGVKMIEQTCGHPLPGSKSYPCSLLDVFDTSSSTGNSQQLTGGTVVEGVEVAAEDASVVLPTEAWPHQGIGDIPILAEGFTCRKCSDNARVTAHD